MRHHPITVGQEVGGFGVRCTDSALAPYLAVPEIARFIAEGLTESAAKIEADIDSEVHAEITRNIDIAFSDDAYAPGLAMDNAEADRLELEAASEEDPIARKELLLEVRRLRERGRRETRLEAREAAKANALQRERDKLGRKDRESQREQNKQYAAMLREVAAQIQNGVPAETAVTATSWALDRHTCVFGSSGSGKTRLVLHLLKEQMAAGCSVLAIDPKPEAVRDLLSCAIDAGVAPEDVVLMKPGDGMSVPGWNPLLGDDPPDVAASVVRGFFTGLTEFRDRMIEVLRNAIIVVSTHRLSLAECRPLISSAPYRHALLASEPPGKRTSAYHQAVRYFQEDFETWPETGRDETVRAVNNRLNNLLESPFFSALLCARRNTLNLADLWRRQKVVIVHLDQRSLSREGAQIIGGLIAYQAFQTAMKVGSTDGIPVVLALDEIGSQEKFLGGSLEEITTFSRSQGLRLLVATQHLNKVSPSLLEAFLGNAKFLAFFQISDKDARAIAGTLAAKEPVGKGISDRTRRLEISRGEGHREWVLPLSDEWGKPLERYVPPSPDEVVWDYQEEEVFDEVVEEVSVEGLPPCPEPIPLTSAPTLPVVQTFVLPQEVFQKLQKIERFRKEAQWVNDYVNNQTIHRYGSIRPTIKYGQAEVTETQRDKGIEYVYNSFYGRKKEETWLQLRIDSLLERVHIYLHPQGRRRKPLTAQSFKLREDEQLLTWNDLEWIKRKQEHDAMEGERQAALAKYAYDLGLFQQQVYLRNQEISQWHAHLAAAKQKLYEEQAAAARVRAEARREQAAARHREASERYYEAVALAALQNEERIRQREEEISNRSSQEFTGSQRIADVYTWLRRTFEADNFSACLDDEECIDLAALLRQLIRCGLEDDDLVWRMDFENSAIILTVPEILITASNAFNPDTRADWEVFLQTLPSRHAAVRTAQGDGEWPRTSILRVVDVPDSFPESSPQFQAFLRTARDANSQSVEEIEETERWREEQIDALIAANKSGADTDFSPPVPATKPSRSRSAGSTGSTVSANKKSAPTRELPALTIKTLPPPTDTEPLSRDETASAQGPAKGTAEAGQDVDNAVDIDIEMGIARADAQEEVNAPPVKASRKAVGAVKPPSTPETEPGKKPIARKTAPPPATIPKAVSSDIREKSEESGD